MAPRAFLQGIVSTRRTLAYRALHWANTAIPKAAERVLFLSNPDYDDNSLALYLHLRRSRPGRYRFAWLVADPVGFEEYRKRIDPDGPVVEYAGQYSPRGVRLFLRSRWIFVTHGLHADLPLSARQTLVNLWHGMPLKRIGRWTGAERQPRSHYTVSTSPTFQKILAYAFDQTEQQVLVTGQPRSEFLFEAADHLGRLDIDPAAWRQVVLWAPTFRDDGDASAGLPVVGAAGMQDLDRGLRERGVLLVVKLHPADVLNRVEFPSTTNIKVFGSADLRARGARLQNILGEVDVLWTDFSSIYVDFLLTGRPMGFPFEDLDAYAAERGFLFDNVRERLPGPILGTVGAMLDSLDSLMAGDDDWAERRVELNDELNVVQSDFSDHLLTQIGMD